METVSGDAGRKAPAGPPWTFLTNHAHVLICLMRDLDATMRDVAYQVGITERAVQRIVSDLETGGIVRRVRDGRRNHYEVSTCHHLRHPVEAHCTIGDLLSALAMPASPPLSHNPDTHEKGSL